MKQGTLGKGFLIAALAAPLLLAGCKKKNDAASTGSGTGSAPPAAGSAVAAAPGSAAAPAAGDGAAGPAKVTVKRQGEDLGTYDKAIYHQNTSGGFHVSLAQNCPKFNCNHLKDASSLDSDAFTKDCPTGKVMVIQFEVETDQTALKPGPVKVSLMGEDDGRALNEANSVDGGTITEVTDKQVKGSVDLKEGAPGLFAKSSASGDFTAMVCKK